MLVVARGGPKAPKFLRLPAKMKMALEEHDRRTRLPENIAIEVAIEEYLAKYDLWPFEVSAKELRDWMSANEIKEKRKHGE